MDRKEFLQGIGVAGLSAIIPSNTQKVAQRVAAFPPDCILTPSETAGPFPLDLTTNAFYFRQDVREDRLGVEHRVKMLVVGADNCLPMPNVRVNIWHCDKDGNYSGYGNQTGTTYCRGYQITDANGEVEFVTVFPGWYNGRICHIHFQVFVSSIYSAVSQFTYPLAEKNAIYAAFPALYTKGADPKTFTTDGIFADGYEYQLANLEANAAGDVYSSFFTVVINGSGVSGLKNAEPETGGQFKLLQNFPNPYERLTTVPFELLFDAEVQLDVFDLQGRKVHTVPLGRLAAGQHNVPLNLSELGIPTATYVYQLETTNAQGTFRQCKVMTAIG
jgi:protocatechuate 3,4-dioxygenase beta subunit